ncbi:hypothetical protein SDC9_86661 [bioreactor metagenome]|uniref:Uncharacterized protein n=1 Tax=bioreactor metagenome TaxID=1076179 RepID=A0A644ZMU7_9ZZZZ
MFMCKSKEMFQNNRRLARKSDNKQKVLVLADNICILANLVAAENLAAHKIITGKNCSNLYTVSFAPIQYLVCTVAHAI